MGHLMKIVSAGGKFVVVAAGDPIQRLLMVGMEIMAIQRRFHRQVKVAAENVAFSIGWVESWTSCV